MTQRTPRQLLWAGALLVAGCQLPPPAMQHADERPPLARVESVRSEALAAGRLRIRLAGPDGQQSLIVLGTQSGALHFERDGDVIHNGAGESRTSFLIPAGDVSGGLQIGNRHYIGELAVELHEERGLRVMNHVGLEDYVAGVVPSELVLWSAEESEIAAQAIAARTYALRSLRKRNTSSAQASLWDDTRDQVYIGIFRGESSAAAQRVLARYRRGLELSRGRVVIDQDGDLYDLRFHASCGGMTCSPAEAFPLESVFQHAPVACEPCRKIGADERTWPADDKRRRKVHWSWTADAASLAGLAKKLDIGTRIVALRPLQVDANGRWQSIELRGDAGTRTLSIEFLRRDLDPARLKSGVILRTWPAQGQPISGGLFFEGLGRGHGAGLCQIGSHEYASQGWSASQILRHYLPGSSLTSLSEPTL